MGQCLCVWTLQSLVVEVRFVQALRFEYYSTVFIITKFKFEISGSTLRELQAADLSDIPNFVRKCIECIEKGDLLKTDGVYRQSGNLSTIQKIRLQVDQGNLAIIDSVEDVHVLTGSLKLFFR